MSRYGNPFYVLYVLKTPFYKTLSAWMIRERTLGIYNDGNSILTREDSSHINDMCHLI